MINEPLEAETYHQAIAVRLKSGPMTAEEVVQSFHMDPSDEQRKSIQDVLDIMFWEDEISLTEGVYSL